MLKISFNMKNIMKFILLVICIIQITPKNDYQIKNIIYSDNKDSLTANLEYASDVFNISDYHIPQIRNDNISPIDSLNISISIECDDIFHLKITDKYNQRWEPPFILDDEYENRILKCREERKTRGSNRNFLKEFGFLFTNETSENFAFDLIDKRNNQTYFHFA